MPDGEGVYTSTGELVCRLCANTRLIAETDRQVARNAAPAWAPDRPDTAGYWALAPIAVFTLWSVAQSLQHWAGGRGCSELSCMSLVLVPALGILVSLPCTIVAVMKLPAAMRRRGAFAAFGAMLLMLGTCVAPL